MYNKALQSFLLLEKYCREEDFKGWDPYDGLNSKVFKKMPFFPKKKMARLVWIQLIKKLPVNFRNLLKIDKDYNPKGISLFLSGYCQLNGNALFKEEYADIISFLAQKLISLRTEGYSGFCWGYNFDWESRAFFQPRSSPTIVATTFAANALIDAYQLTNNSSYLDAAVSATNFVTKDLNRTYGSEGKFAFSYSPYDQTSVFNASLLGARLLSRIYFYTRDVQLAELAQKAVGYCCDFQNADGSWYYSTLPFHQWIDNFHTGFNLECIYEYGYYTGDNRYVENFEAGMDYYLNTFFDTKGRSRYYNNSLYPIDIHAPSQLIITLAKANLFLPHTDLINKVLQWTIDNMQSEKGYFYFQMNKMYTNKIPYMRWSQGWIFYALACYLKNAVERDAQLPASVGLKHALFNNTGLS